MSEEPGQDAAWPTAMATVLRCKYETRAGRALAFGLPSSKHFRIAYNYWANGDLHEGECFSEKALPAGSLVPIRYNPDQPHQSQHAAESTASRGPLILFGLLGSIILSLAWLLVLHSCSPAH